MERFNEDLVLTTSQAADLLDVHPSTVKRWCDRGELPSNKTDGGHRRIHLQDVLGTAHEKRIRTYLDRFDPYQPHVWSAVTEAEDRGTFRKVHSVAMGWLARGHLDRVGWLFRELGRRPTVPFPVFCDEGVGGFMEKVGDAWRDGRLRIGEEHLASQVLVEALLELRTRAHVEGGNGARGWSGTALVGSVEGDQHHLGSLCVRLLLERRGWRVFYMGPDVPVEDFALLQRSRSADLVCISFSDVSAGADAGRSVRILAELYDRARPYALALGGDIDASRISAAEAVPFTDLGTFASLSAFDSALDAGFGVRTVARGMSA